MGHLLDLTKKANPSVTSSCAKRRASESERREIVHLLTLLRCGPEHPDHGEALQLALDDPDAHLKAFRESIRPRARA